MKAKDLLKLADEIERVPRRGFDMESFADGDQAAMRKAKANGFRCGMAACIGGHAALVFPRRLRLSRDAFAGRVCLQEVGEVRDGFVAFAHAFDICKFHAEELCSLGARHWTPKAAAEAIRRLAKERPECRFEKECEP